MAAIPVTITGVLADKYGRTLQAVTLFGELSRSDVGVGGGPIMPPDGTKPPGGPPGIWPGPGDPDFPGGLPPIERPPPDVTIPPPGSPPMALPGTQPVLPIVPPPAIVVQYPGIGKVLVPQPLPPS